MNERVPVAQLQQWHELSARTGVRVQWMCKEFIDHKNVSSLIYRPKCQHLSRGLPHHQPLVVVEVQRKRPAQDKNTMKPTQY